jgi:hypothetical protein
LPGNRRRESTGKRAWGGNRATTHRALPNVQLRDRRHTSGATLQYGEGSGWSSVMSKLFVIAALAFALATGTIIDAVTIVQAAHADCISKNC